MKDFGDFQTPPDLAAEIVALFEPLSGWDKVLEPTCGKGNFIAAVCDASSRAEIKGIELQPQHVAEARERFKQLPNVNIIQADSLALDLTTIGWHRPGRMLVIGNPPWVTNSELGSLKSSNLPEKRNLKNLKGIDAITGAANFDIAEFIWLKLITELAPHRPTIALLCKTSVARNVLQYCADFSLPLTNAWMRRIDAARWFGVAADACVFAVDIGEGQPRYEAAVFADLAAREVSSTIAVRDGQLIADVAGYSKVAHLDGDFKRQWRQGVKHDAANVMELDRSDDGLLTNKLGERVEVESAFVYPLLKSTDLYHGRQPSREVIVTQRHPGEDTFMLESKAPRLWRYLRSHTNTLDGRKSSIYTNRGPFAMFGVGPYSFALHKVAVSGLHKEPRFRFLGPVRDQPVMLDDTCYFVPCASAGEAAFITALLNSPLCLSFIGSIVHWDSKRPLTKKLLQRIDIVAVARSIHQDELLKRTNAVLTEARSDVTPVSVQDLEEFVCTWDDPTPAGMSANLTLDL